MKKEKIIDVPALFIVGSVILLLYIFFCYSCTVTKPIYNGKDMNKYHTELQKYYDYKAHKK